MDILNEVKALFTNDVVHQASTQFNENEGVVSKAIGAIVPALLGGFASKAQTNHGASDLFNLITNQFSTQENEGFNFSRLLGNTGAISSGWELVKGLFGGQSDNLLSRLTSYSGSKVSTVTSLLGLAAPLIINWFGKHIKSNNLNASGLASLLSSQKSGILSAIPAGLGLDNVFSSAFKGDDRTVHTTVKETPNYEKTTTTTYVDRDDKGGGGKWVLPLLLILGLGALALWLFNRDKTETPETVVTGDSLNQVVTPVDTGSTTVNYVDPITIGTYDSVSGNFKYNLGNDVELKLADGKTIKVGENSAEARLFNFLSDANSSVNADKTKDWWSLESVYFETGKDVLTAASKRQLENIAAILKNFPNARLKFGGYTDNTGDPAANVTLSNQRAISAMNFVKGLAIDAGRMEAEGYGEAHPKATNETPEGRAVNRRVDVRVLAK